MNTKKENIFEPLVKMFPGDQGEEIIKIFDTQLKSDGVGEDQVKINGLAMLLTCLEDGGEDVFGKNSHLSVPIMCKTQALEAAYHLGRQKVPAASERSNNQ